MNPAVREIHVEHLLGRRVRDVAGAVVGRIEELRAEVIDGEPVITEIHLGPAALWERLGGFALQLPFVRFLPVARYEHRLPWSLVDLTDPDQPRVLERQANLHKVRVDEI